MWRQRCREGDRQTEPQGQETEKQSEQARQRCDGRGRHLSMSGHVLHETIGSGEGQHCFIREAGSEPMGRRRRLVGGGREGGEVLHVH